MRVMLLVTADFGFRVELNVSLSSTYQVSCDSRLSKKIVISFALLSQQF